MSINVETVPIIPSPFLAPSMNQLHPFMSCPRLTMELHLKMKKIKRHILGNEQNIANC